MNAQQSPVWAAADGSARTFRPIPSRHQRPEPVRRVAEEAPAAKTSRKVWNAAAAQPLQVKAIVTLNATGANMRKKMLRGAGTQRRYTAVLPKTRTCGRQTK